MDSNNTLYYMRLPPDMFIFTAHTIYPVLERSLWGKDFRNLDEALCLSVSSCASPVHLHAFSMDVTSQQPHTAGSSYQIETPQNQQPTTLDIYAEQFAHFLREYIQRNKGKLKMVTFGGSKRDGRGGHVRIEGNTFCRYDVSKIDDEEEQLLRKAVEILGNKGAPLRLEEVVARRHRLLRVPDFGVVRNLRKLAEPYLQPC